MNMKFLAASLLAAGVSLSSMAQGYKDGIEYYKVGQFDNAKELLERNLNDASTNKAASYYYLGMIALKGGNVAEAKANFEKGVAADANYGYNYVGLGQLALKSGGNAGDMFSKARKTAKKDCKLETAIARAYYDVNPTAYAKDIEKCLKNARKWSMTDPDSFIFEGDTYTDAKDYGKAAGQYEYAFTQDPDNTEATVKFANTYYFVNPTMALERLEQFNAAHPANALVQRQLAEKYYESNMGGKAAEKYGEYINNPNHFTQDEVRYVQLAYFGGKYQESYDLASSIYNSLAEGKSERFFMQRMKLYNKVSMKQWTDAIAEAEAFFAMSKPANATYEAKDYYDYAYAMSKLDDANNSSEHAIKCAEMYEKAFELKPDNLDYLRSAGDSYKNAGNFDKALETYNKVLNSGNADVNDFFDLGRTYYNMAANTEDEAVKTDAIAKAREYVAKADSMSPDNATIINTKARIEKLAEGKPMGKASADFLKLVKLLDAKENKANYGSWYRTAYQYLGNASANQKDMTTAKEYYSKWLEWDPNNEELRKYVNAMK